MRTRPAAVTKRNNKQFQVAWFISSLLHSSGNRIYFKFQGKCKSVNCRICKSFKQGGQMHATVCRPAQSTYFISSLLILTKIYCIYLLFAPIYLHFLKILQENPKGGPHENQFWLNFEVTFKQITAFFKGFYRIYLFLHESTYFFTRFWSIYLFLPKKIGQVCI